MRLPIIALLSVLLLSGCGTARSSGGFAVIKYDQETLNKAADEMESGLAPTLNMMMNDYSVLRDQARIK